MKIGDLVRYGWENDHGIGIITHLLNNFTCTVLWADGTTSNHSSRWLIRIEEIK
jgi:hypothetical protein